MMSCTDLSGGKKGSAGSSSFKGPALKDVKVEKSLGPSYKPSQKSRDWSTLSQNLEDAFIVSSPSSSRAVTSQGVIFQQPTPAFSPQPIAQQVHQNVKEDWGDFQNFNQKTNSIQNSSQNIFSHKVEDAVGGYGLAFTSSNSKTFAVPSASLAPQTQPTSNLDDDDFADFVTATPNTNVSSLTPSTTFLPESYIPSLPSVPPLRASSLSTPTSNILQSAEISSSNTILSSKTIGSRLATFQEESPIHRFKANIPVAVDNPSLLEGPNKDQVITEDNDDDFGDFASARHNVITSSNTNTFPISLDRPHSVANTNNPFLTHSDVRGSNTDNSFVTSFTASPVLQPISSTHDDKYSAFRNAFSDDHSTNKSDTIIDESNFPPGIESETNKPKDRTSDLFGGGTISMPTSSNSIITDLTVSSLEPKSVSSLSQQYAIPKSTNPLNTEAQSINNEEDDFGDFIAVRNEKPAPTLASNDFTNLASISSVKPKSTENKHVRSDAFFMPQPADECKTSAIMPVWHDSEPPPLLDEQHINTGIDIKPVGTGALKDDFFEGFDDNDVTSTEEPVGAFGCSSILDEDQYFEAPQIKNHSIPPEIDTKLSEEQMPANLNIPPIPRKNSISSLNLRVGSSSPEDVDENQRSEAEECHNMQTNAKQYEKKSDVKDDLSLNKSFKSPLKEWLSMLTQIHLLISQATDSFTYIPSNAVLEEVLESKKGSNYIKNIVEVYRVFKRIQISYQKYTENKSYNHTAIIKTNEDEDNKDMVQKGEKIEQAWKQLIINLNGRSIIPEKAVFNFAQCLLKEIEHKKEKKENGGVDDSCGLCLLSVSTSNYLPKGDKESIEMVDTVLEHGNRMYHSTCANFWVNRVDLVLPRLTLTS